MVITANSGPYLGFGITMSSTGQVMQYNEERGPSTFDLGSGLADPRPAYSYSPGSAVGSKVAILWDNAAYVDFVPTALSTNGIVSNSQPTASTALTITASGSAMVSTTIVAPESGATVSVYCIGSTAATVPYGQSGTIAGWNPQAGTGRCITVGLSSNADGGTFTVAGRDMYGYPMTEQITVGSTNNFAGKKAFKYISAVKASSTISSTGVIIGYNDTFGFPAKLAYCGINSAVQLLATAYSSAVAVALSSATISLASTAATQTSTTPDVRGTYASTTASNGTLRVQIYQGFDAFTMSQISASDQSAIFGATQFSSV